MATKSEQFHAEAQRTGKAKAKTAKRAKANKPGSPAGKRSRDTVHGAKKATYALEDNVGRPSRKSTRKSSNHAKTDVGLTGREQLRKGAPEARFAKSRAKSSKVRGHSKNVGGTK